MQEGYAIKETKRGVIILVLVILFALPILAYLFFLSAEHGFNTLPVVKNEVGSLSEFTSVGNSQTIVTTGDKELTNQITLLSIYGSDPQQHKLSILNMNEKMYKTFSEFSDLQFVTLFTQEGWEAFEPILYQMDITTDVSRYKYFVGTGQQIIEFYNTLGMQSSLDDQLSTSKVFLIDKDGALRGRPEDKDRKEEEIRGYQTASMADMKNYLVEDTRILLAEYRRALKKNNKYTIDE